MSHVLVEGYYDFVANSGIQIFDTDNVIIVPYYLTEMQSLWPFQSLYLYTNLQKFVTFVKLLN